MEKRLPKLTLVLGGVASGKSRYAEGLVLSEDARRVYIATAEAQDGEMQAKIARHRETRGPDWQTVEAPLDVAGALAKCGAGDVVLLDCATLWLSNHMGAGSDLEKETHRLIGALAGCAAPVVVVSNEVGLGGIADNALARRFQNKQGRLNQALAAEAGLVVMVIAGMPTLLKGNLS